MSKLFNQSGYIENGQFSGGLNVTASNDPLPFVAGGVYVGQTGNLVVKTVDGSVLTFVSASGFIPGLVTQVDPATTAGSIVALK
jgi:hypothetical protein